MEALGVVGIIILIILALLAFSLFGWALKGLEVVWDFLSEGCSTSFGCIFWIIAIIVVLMALL